MNNQKFTQADVDAFKQFMNSAEWQAFITQFAAITQQVCEALVELMKALLDELSAAQQDQNQDANDDH